MATHKINTAPFSSVTYKVINADGETVSSGFAKENGGGEYEIDDRDAAGGMVVVYVGGDEHSRIAVA